MEYTAVIRTLGKARDKYQVLLNSLARQTVLPSDIIVYIAEGYPLPNETIGIEKYVFVKKGMVAQRALPYTEVKTEYVLYLDDDLYLPEDSVERMFSQLSQHGADIISPDVFPNARRGFLNSLMMTISGRMRSRWKDSVWGYKVMMTAGYSYNAKPIKDVYWSQTNAGPCFLCKKSTMLNIHFEEELWLDRLQYPMGEDQVMFYKMYKKGYKQLTSYNTGIVHLDAGGNRNLDKEKVLIYSDIRFKTIFWHRFIYSPEHKVFRKVLASMAISYAFLFTLLISIVRLRFDILSIKFSAINDGIGFIRSKEYRLLPKI